MDGEGEEGEERKVEIEKMGDNGTINIKFTDNLGKKKKKEK
jgi:hypothetical protein